MIKVNCTKEQCKCHMEEMTATRLSVCIEIDCGEGREQS